MNLTIESGASLAPFSSLVVDPVQSDLTLVVAALSGLHLKVTTAETFAQAREHMVQHCPNVLITAIRLGEYNGLHLVMRGKAERPDMTAVVTCPARDPVLAAEAEAMGATFIELPTSEAEIRTAILRTLLRTSPEPIRAPFERRRVERRAVASVAIDGADRRTCYSDRRRALLMSTSEPLVS